MVGSILVMPSRGPYAKGVAKREEILKAALEVIARHGYRNTSTRELAAAVGLSEAGLLHYFGSKEKLFEAVLRARIDTGAHAVAGPGGATPVAARAGEPVLVDLIRTEEGWRISDVRAGGP